MSVTYFLAMPGRKRARFPDSTLRIRGLSISSPSYQLALLSSSKTTPEDLFLQPPSEFLWKANAMVSSLYHLCKHPCSTNDVALDFNECCTFRYTMNETGN
jgi:hypothetical protein